MLKTIIKTSGYLACLLASGVASAMGLGGMAVSSNLGQPLKAEIELVAVDKADRNSIVAKLASVEAFKAAGIDYPYVLPKLKFSIANRDSSQPRVLITSVQPINEPFVTLLVEVTWPSGKLMREYTFLLDPVGFNIEPQAETVRPVAPVVTTPPALSEPLPLAQPAAAAALATTAPAAEAPVETAPVEEAPVETTPATKKEMDAAEIAAAEAAAFAAAMAEDKPAAEPVKEAVPESVPEAAPVTVQDALSKEEAIPVAESIDIKVVRGDTLSKIALKVKPADVSLERMLVAMYRANGDAFMGKNMNRLKAGKIIRVPDAAEIEAIQQGEAVREYRAQVEDWNAYRQQLASVRAEAREQAAQQTDSGKVTAAVTEKAVSKEAPLEVLKLSKGEVPGDSLAAGSATSKEEESVAKAKALKDAQERTALLEKNVKDLQRLAELKKQQAETASKAVPTPDAGVPTAVIGASAPVPAKPVAKPAVPAPVEVPPVEVSFIDTLLEDPVLLGGGAAGLLALLGGGLWLSRRRASPAPKKEAALPEETDVGSSTGRIAEPVMPSPETGDFTQQADETHEDKASDEVDPIAEADLFLTFGRDVQAEEVLKEALNAKPGDTPIILKLLSIYSTRKDANAFMTYARQIKDGGDEAAWQQAAAMGRELEPGNPFYGGEGESSEAVTPQAEETAEPAVDFDLGFGTSSDADAAQPSPFDTMISETFATDKGEEQSAQAEDFLGTVVMQPETKSSESTTILSAEEMQAASEAPMDFDITGTHPGSQSQAGASAATDEGASADDLIFDVTSTHSGVPGQMAEEPADGVNKAAAEDDLVFDVTTTHPGFQTSAEPATAETAETGLDDLMFDVSTALPEVPAATSPAAEVEVPAADDGLTFTLDIPEDVSSEEEQPSAPLDIGLGDISLNLDSLGGGEAASEAVEVKDERWQEVATKLDLAKAYQEMGDGAGAKEILEEVLRDGDDQQRATAQSILDQL